MSAFGRRHPVHVADVINSVIHEAEGHPKKRRRPSAAVKIFRAFEQLGPPIATRAEPSFYRRGVLTLTIEDSAWLTELHFLVPEMIARINAILGEPKVEDIRFKHGALTPRRAARAKALTPPELTDAQKVKLAEMVEPIHDPEVRAAVLGAARWAITKS